MKTNPLHLCLLAGSAALMGLNSCGEKKSNDSGENKKGHGIYLANMDTTVRPQDDFFQYVNGNWIKNNPIPAAENGWGNFNELRDKSVKDLNLILTEAAADKAKASGSNKQRIGDFYTSAMDSDKIEKLGYSPLKEDFAMIDQIKTKEDLLKAITKIQIEGATSLFNVFIGSDNKNSEVNITTLSQGGMGLPDRDYYFMKGTEHIVKEYEAYATSIFQHLDYNPAEAAKAAGHVLAIEKKLAEKARNSVQQRDIPAQYNKKSKAELASSTPNINWDLFFKDAQFPSTPNEVIVAQPEFFARLNEMIVSVPVAEWKNYLKFNLTSSFAPYLSKAFVMDHFHFYATVLSGTKEIKPRWKRVTQATNNNLPDALGQLYVDKYFSPESKKRVTEMVDNFITVYKERLTKLEWMSDATKKQAQAKLEMVTKKIGYPDKWVDYTGLEITPESYVTNIKNVSLFQNKRFINKLTQPVDRKEWFTPAATINAYYNPQLNEIVFPAGILQPPFFDAEADDAVNYGAIGAVIGHELTHGFDDQGCQYDSKGNMVNWWTDNDKKQFNTKAGAVIEQFNNFVAIDTFHVNGHLTIGENIADLGGATIAYCALKKSLEGKTVGKVDGFTPEQRFFIAYAQNWKAHRRPESLKQLIKVDPHSPERFRVIGPLTNMAEFYQAFNVKESDKMYVPAEKRAAIW